MRVAAFAAMTSLAACSSTPTRSAVPQPIEPPYDLTLWQKLDWVQERMEIATADERPLLLARSAELWLSVGRGEKAGSTAREALYVEGGSRVASRAHAVVGGAALLRGDLDAARAELDRAAQKAGDASERSVAYALLALAAERAGKSAEAETYRSRVPRAGDARLADLMRAFGPAPPGPATANRASTGASSGASAVPGVAIIGRAEWRAASSGSDTDPMGAPRLITVHHEGKEFHGATRDEALREVKNIQSYHQRSNRWADIGYHFVIDPLGNVIEGRPITLQGAHAGQRSANGTSPNAGNIGISCLGHFDTQRLPARQERALRELIGALQSKYGIGRGDVYTHNEIRKKFGLAGTACPGKNLKPVIEEIRARGALAGAEPGTRLAAR